MDEVVRDTEITSSYRVYPGTPVAGIYTFVGCPSDEGAIRMLATTTVWGIDSLRHVALEPTFGTMEGSVGWEHARRVSLTHAAIDQCDGPD